MKKIIFTLTILVITQAVFGLTIGTAPGHINFGTLYKGQKVRSSIYLLTRSTNKFLVSASTTKPHYGIFMSGSKDSFIPKEASEEASEDWVNFPENPILISPDKPDIKIQLSSGGTVSADANVDFVLNVPNDAEPGYHAGAISLNPDSQGGEGGTRVQTLGLTRFYFWFRVDGEAKRKGKIMDILAQRTGETEARIDVLFQNTGSTTMITELENIKIFDEENNPVASIPGSTARVSPQNSKIFSTFWRGEKVKLQVADIMAE